MAHSKHALVTTQIDLQGMSLSQRIYALWNQGLSHNQIGAVVGRTKGTISYHVARGRKANLDLPWRTSATRPANPTPKPAAAEAVVLAPPMLEQPVLAPPPPAASLNRHRDRTCQFVLRLAYQGGLQVCGDPIEDRTSYCSYHRAICHVPPKPVPDESSYSAKTVPAGRFGSMGDYR